MGDRVKFSLEKLDLQVETTGRAKFGLGDKEEKRERAAPKKQERSFAKKTGGSRQPLSGARDEAKGDVKIDRADLAFLVDCKHTKHASVSLTEEWLLKITKEALAAGKHPLMELELGGALSLSCKRWVAMPTPVFELLLELLNERSPLGR